MTTLATKTAHGAAILGTAGHIDHGKTALIRALTGQDTDRLKEEKERGISIELGFAFYEIDGRRYGVVDVPGHDRFLRNMLAGAHGIDLVLLVVAADDGVMPQTEEHFDIVHLLGARRAIFVITKIDLVDERRVAEVRSEIEVLAAGTAYESAPVCAVSSVTGAGLDELRAAIVEQIATLPPRDPSGWFRMPIDRAFVIHGHGLVVTGTAVSGVVREGDPLALRPGDVTTRARTIQVHGETVTQAGAGQRVAVNLGGLDRNAARRGLVLSDPRVEFPTDRFDCWLEVRPGAKRPLRSFDRVRVYVGTAETMGRVIVLGAQELAPKSHGHCQIVVDEELMVANGDRFILRSENATRTTGGGEVLHPFATRHRTVDDALLARLARLREPALQPRIHAFLELLHEFAAPVGYVAQAMNRTDADVRRAAAGLPEIVPLPEANDPQAYTTRDKWRQLAALVAEVLRHYHRVHPLESGMEAEALRSRLRVPVPPRLFRPVLERLEAEGVLVREQALVRLPTHKVELAQDDADVATRVARALESGGFTPPDVKQIQKDLDLTYSRLLEVLRVLERQGRVVRVGPDLWYASAALEQARVKLREFLASRPEITVAEYRTLLGASRKYALALLEYFDSIALTIRVGDARKLRRPA
ncbi:MAG TPA: selenocysteine-specific translation elongation factor [Candidatus Binatia bacterium]